MTPKAQYHTLRFGGVSADIALFATSGKPKESVHETKRVLAQLTEPEPRVATPSAPPTSTAVPSDGGFTPEPPPMSDPTKPEATLEEIAAERSIDGGPLVHTSEHRGVLEVDPLADGPTEAQHAAETYGLGEERFEQIRESAVHRPAAQEYVAPETTVQQGVTTASGEWVDLTDRLKEIDERTKLDAMEVVATIASSAVPRERVRGAQYVGGADPKTYKVLRLLWVGLRANDAAAVVRWTARTQQRLGIIVARVEPRCLLLLEVEWWDNMRKPSERVMGPLGAEVTERERDAAVLLVESLHASPAALNDLRDERLAKRGELLTAAKEGTLETFVAPPEPEPVAEVEDVAEAMLAAAR